MKVYRTDEIRNVVLLGHGGQCLTGSLTGAVASERVSEALKGSLRMVGNHLDRKSVV